MATKSLPVSSSAVPALIGKQHAHVRICLEKCSFKNDFMVEEDRKNNIKKDLDSFLDIIETHKVLQ